MSERHAPASPKREDETSPFPLERKSENGLPAPDTATASLDPSASIERERPRESDPHGERTGPFLLERERSSAGDVPAEHEAVAPVAPTHLSKSARRARRTIAGTLLVHTLLLGGLATASIVRWTKGMATPPELGLAVLSIGVALVHLRAAGRFSRLGRKPARDGHLLAGALSDLRTVIVLKAVTLFLALTLLCFSLSMVISLVASI